MRLDLLEDICMLSKTEEKTVQPVKNCLGQKFYIRKIMRDCAELQTCCQLMQHPYSDTPMLYEATHRGETHILMEEFIDGAILEYVLSERPPDDAAIYHTMQQLLPTIERLHSLRPPVIYRDIKPENIMVLEHLEIRLIDFEIVRVFKRDKNRNTYVVGSVGYASPEQCGFHQNNYRGDIYAIGAVLKMMVQESVMAKDIHSPFQHIIETCIQLDPGKHHQNADELQKALDYYGERSPPHAPVSALLSQLPGIRRDSVARRLLFLAYYRLRIILGASMTVTPLPPPYSLICQRITLSLRLAIIPAIMVNAGNVRELLPLQDHGRASMRFFKGTILWFLCAFIIISLLVTLAAILESLL